MSGGHAHLNNYCTVVCEKSFKTSKKFKSNDNHFKIIPFAQLHVTVLTNNFFTKWTFPCHAACSKCRDEYPEHKKGL